MMEGFKGLDPKPKCATVRFLLQGVAGQNWAGQVLFADVE
jgi:hypothetical protein